MNDTVTPFGVVGRMCFQKIPIPFLNVTFNTTAIQKQLCLGLCACNLKQRSITIFFDHRKEHASTRGLTQHSTVPSCKTLLDQSLPPSTGICWINHDGVSQSNAFKGNGRVADWQDGDINCMIIKHVTNTCKETLAPSFFGSGLGFGPIFFINSCYYKFDALTEYDWPVRDPCGKGELNQLNGVAEPRGNIFIHLLMNINCSPMGNFSCQW